MDGTRAARPGDAPALGHLMVESWLAAHREQIPDAAWRARVAEWTPEVSARGWARLIADIAATEGSSEALLVAEDVGGMLVGLVHGVVDEPTRGRVSSLYVAPYRHREGIGAELMRAAAAVLLDLGVTAIRVSVLTANVPARRFYERIGGLEVGRESTDEDGYELPTTVYEWSDAAVLART